MSRYFAIYLHILGQVSLDGCLFLIYALLLPVGKSRISDLRSKILTLGKIKLKLLYLFFRSLNRIIDLRSKILTLGKIK